MDHPRRKISFSKAWRAVSRAPGFTLLEIVVAMAIGGLLFVGLGSLLQMFGKSMKQVKELGDYTVLKGVITRQLKGMNGGNCLQYIQPGAQAPNRASPIPITLLKTPTVIPSGSPISPDLIRFNADGSTLINGNKYRMLLSTTNPACFDDFENSCVGTLTLEMTRTSSSKLYKGTMVHSQVITELLFNIDESHTQILGCNYIQTPKPGEIDVDSANGCMYPPAFPSANVPVGGEGERIQCPPGYGTLGVCVAGMKSVPSPLPIISPSPTYTPAYCTEDKSKFSQLGCCPMAYKYALKASRWENIECNQDKSEIVTGICSSDPNPAPHPPEYFGEDQYPRMNDTSCSKSVQCTVAQDKKGNTINYQKHFCYEIRFNAGEMTSCDYEEVMVGYCDGVKCGGGRHIKCCPITNPK